MKANWYNSYTVLFTAVLVATPLRLHAQDFSRIEAGIHTSVLPGNRFGSATDIGIGGTFTYNLNRLLALDSQLDEYTTNVDALKSLQFGGRAVAFSFGVKGGLRKRRFGIYFKARPGLLTFSDALVSEAVFGQPGTKRITHATLDVAGSAEYNLSRRIILSADFGPLLVRYGDALLATVPTPAGIATARSTGKIDAPWHLNLGASYRFGKLQEHTEINGPGDHLSAGFQYSLLSLERSLTTVRDESGIGGWATWSFSKFWGLDSSLLFFPRNVKFADFQQGGRIMQGLVGIRAGIREGRIGVFAKFRPGLQLYTATLRDVRTAGTAGFTNLAFDSGAIVEIYTSRHTKARFDAGDTAVLYRARDVIALDGSTVHLSGFSKQTIQIMAGFGVAF